MKKLLLVLAVLLLAASGWASCINESSTFESNEAGKQIIDTLGCEISGMDAGNVTTLVAVLIAVSGLVLVIVVALVIVILVLKKK